MKHFFVISLALGLSSAALAQNQAPMETAANTPSPKEATQPPSLTTECVAGSVTRKIWISYESQSGDNCKVHYEKPQENGPEKVLWSAQQDPNFCQQKAQQLIEKQKGWSFVCTTAN